MDPVKKLLICEEIRKLRALYGIYTDTKRSREWADLFTEDCVFDERYALTPKDPVTKETLPVKGFDNEWLDSIVLNSMEWPIRGREAVYEHHYAQLHSEGITAAVKDADDSQDTRCLATQHAVYNGAITVDSETTASGIWPTRIFAQYADKAPITRLWFPAVYYDTYEEVDGKWLIASVDFEVQWLDVEGPQ